MLAAAAPSAAQEGAGAPAIVTTGEAIVRRAPDVAYLTLAVESRAASPRDAQRQNADTMAAVQKALASASVPRDALKTVSAWLDQQFDNVNGRRVSRGYVARNTLEVRVDEVGRAGELADVAVQAGATSLSGVRFDLKDRAGAERDAVRLAVENARDRAEAAAMGAGRSVDRVLRIEDSRAEPIVGPRSMALIAGARAGGEPATNFEPGLIEIAARVTLTVSMK
jgi:uncharacterized protein YggE